MADTSRRILAPGALAALALGAGVAGTGCTGSTGNHDPVLTTLDPIRIAVGERKQMQVTAADDDGDDLEFRFQLTLFPGDETKTRPFNQNLPLERGMKWIAATTTAIFEWGPSPNHVGEHTLTILADDGEGGVAEATAAVTVLGGQEQGAPRFDSHPNLVLDLARTQCLKVRVAVDDADSLEVLLTLEGAPEGMVLKASSDSGKEAVLEWCPEREELDGRNVFTFFAVADDGEHEPVRQRMSVVIKRAGQPGGGGTGPAEGCPQMSAPTIDPVPIADQGGAGDFLMEAVIRDLETEISDAFVSFSWHEDPALFDCYLSTTLFETDDDLWVGSIPGAQELSEEGDRPEGCGALDLTQPVRFYYYICAWDDDDTSEENKCDNATCEPKEGQFSFVWSPEGGGAVPGGECPDDDHDEGGGNDNRASAAAIADGEGFNLVLCPGDEDWYSIEAQAGDTLVIGVGYGGEAGELQVQVFGPDGAAAGQEREDVEAGYKLVEVQDAADGNYIVGVTGSDIGGGGEVYNLIVRREAGGGAAPGDCPADAGEPNDGIPTATVIQPGASGPYGMCGPADTADWYAVEAEAGSVIDVNLIFTHRNDGDLDLELWPPEGAARVARGFSANDNEHIEFTANAAGVWNIAVLGYGGAINTYRMEVSVGAGEGDGEGGGEGGDDPPIDPVCSTDGGAEPNNTFAEAQVLDGPLACATVQEGDADWWAVELDALQGFTANVGFIDADGDIDIEVYAADGATLLLKADSVNDNETAVFPGASAAGRVFLKVLLYGGDQNTYSIALNKRPFGAGANCVADNQEPNDAQDASRFLTFRNESVTQRALTWCGEDDWYRFRITPDRNQSMLGELVYDPARAELVVELVDAEGNAVGSVTPNGAGTVELQSAHEGTNYLKVTGADGAPAEGLYWFELVLLTDV